MYRVLLLAMVVTGCGSSQSKPKSEEHGELSSGLKCLDDARVVASPAADAPPKIDVSHIVVYHAGLREPKGATRTREEACLRAQEVRNKLLVGGDWEVLHAEYSDSKDATKGAFRFVSQDNLEKDFGNTAFSLKVDELSQVVETENGFHVIWRMK